jgi:hypothetical protein
MRLYHDKVKAIYVYHHLVWSALIIHFDGTKRRGTFYSGEEAHDWVNDYLMVL